MARSAGASLVDVAANLARIRSRIEQAATRCGRSSEEVLVVGVSKGAEVGRIAQAARAGLTDLGENYLQEAAPKIESLRRERSGATESALPQQINWHLVGHLQTNKVKRALELFDLIQTVDSLRLGEEISRRAQAHSRRVPVLVEVNTSGEASKFGVTPEGTVSIVEQLAALPGVLVEGLMTIGPLDAEEQRLRTTFRQLKALFDSVNERVLPGHLRWLSMGMTADFEMAIEEGSNLVRIGTGIFGPRHPAKEVT